MLCSGIPAAGAVQASVDAEVVRWLAQASAIQSEREIFLCSQALSIFSVKVSSMDTEYRTMHNLFDGAVYEDFDFLLHREITLARKSSSGAHRTMHFDAPERTVSQSLIRTLSRKAWDLHVISNSWRVKPEEV
jgi:hypothetical protein